MQAPAGDPEHDPTTAPKAASPGSSAPSLRGVAARLREDEEEQDERQREPVVEPGLEVERVADRRRARAGGHHRRGDDRIGRRRDGAEQERLGPGEVGNSAVRRPAPAGRA